MATLTGRDLEDYRRHILATTRSRSLRAHRKSAVRLLWFYRRQISDGLAFDPSHLDDWAEPHTDGRGENRTDRIPEPVMGPLLAWSLRFIRDFADDILRAAAEAAPLHAAGQRSRGLHLRKSALPGLLAQYEAEGRPLPGYGGKVNLTFLGRKLACPQRCIVRARSLINATAAIVGIDSGTYLDARPAALLDGETWLARFDYSGRGQDSVGTLTRMLQAASYVVTSYLSGMRDAEIKHLRRGCLTARRDSSGAAYRWKVTSLAFKGENDPSGVTATWSVGRPVAEAIAVLERLQPQGQDLLFARLAFREGVRPGSANAAMSSAATSTAISDFASWVNDYCDRGQVGTACDTPGPTWVPGGRRAEAQSVTSPEPVCANGSPQQEFPDALAGPGPCDPVPRRTRRPAVPGRGPFPAHTAPVWARPFRVSPFPSSLGVRPGCGRPRPSLPGTSDFLRTLLSSPQNLSLGLKRVQTEVPSGLAASSAGGGRAPPPGNLAAPVHLWRVTGLSGSPAPATCLPYECLLPAGLTERDSIGIGESGRFSGARMEGLDHWSSEFGAAALVSPERRRPCETARLAGACPRIRRRAGRF